MNSSGLSARINSGLFSEADLSWLHNIFMLIGIFCLCNSIYVMCGILLLHP